MSNVITPPTEEIPVAGWIDPHQLRADPYPTYQRLRSESPVAWVPAVRKVLITDFEGCVFGEQHPEIFSSHVTNAHMIRAMGARPMIRKDDPDHAFERNAVNPTLRPKRIKELWSEVYTRNTEDALDALEDVPAAEIDLNTHYARPLAAKNLLDTIGFRDVGVDAFARWSADFIAGAGNVLEEQSIWERCDATRAEAHEALDALLPYLRLHPDESMASLLLASGMDEEFVRANIFLTISGGVNEPQHMITNIVALLAEHPEQRPGSEADEEEWAPIFDEAVRYYTPIGMVTREAKVACTMNGVTIPPDTQVGLILASANRDAAAFKEPDRFYAGRSERRHLGFGSGAHMCAGKWAAEMSVGRVAVPRLFHRFPGLSVDSSRSTTWDGWAFRGMTSLPVTLDGGNRW